MPTSDLAPPGAVQPRDIRSALPVSGRLPRVGKLRLGIRKQGSGSGRAVEYPSATDYFVVNEDGATSRQAADSFHDIYGPEPRELDVTLPGASLEEVIEGAWRSYGTGGLLKRRCEGPGGQCVTRGDGGVWLTGPCACAAEGLDPSDKKRHCQERFTLTVMLMRVQGVGVWQADTGSRMAAEGLAASLRMIESFRGHLQGAEALLRIVPRQVSPGGVAKTVYIMELGSASLTPAQALELGGGPKPPMRVELPPSTLDEAPDDLLDYDTHEEILAPLPDVDLNTVPEQIKALSKMEQAEFYRVAGIKKGTPGAQVTTMVKRTWERTGFSPMLLPDVRTLLQVLLDIERQKAREPVAQEAFEVLIETGTDIAPGDQIGLEEVS